jgi:hypothetical protein
MINIQRIELVEAIETINSMINRSSKAQEKFSINTSQYTLQKNRIKSLKTALLLIEKELKNTSTTDILKEDLENMVSPISSLISKSEKAQTKLNPESWQYKLLDKNIKSLHIALILLAKSK